MASLELRNGNYRVVFRVGGQKFASSLNTDDSRQADLALARLEDNLT
jgi:anti-sigma regulatory factor (Ser/Thr protein kinase)